MAKGGPLKGFFKTLFHTFSRTTKIVHNISLEVYCKFTLPTHDKLVRRIASTLEVTAACWHDLGGRRAFYPLQMETLYFAANDASTRLPFNEIFM